MYYALGWWNVADTKYIYLITKYVCLVTTSCKHIVTKIQTAKTHHENTWVTLTFSFFVRENGLLFRSVYFRLHNEFCNEISILPSMNYLLLAIERDKCSNIVWPNTQYNQRFNKPFKTTLRSEHWNIRAWHCESNYHDEYIIQIECSSICSFWLKTFIGNCQDYWIEMWKNWEFYHFSLKYEYVY